MKEKEKLYTKLMRIRYNDKIFDIFSGEDHIKTFLEVRIENGKESYYYPILKDYIGLNNIYNKPFDGILHSKKYSFKSKVIMATYIAGVSLMFGQLVTEDYLNYKLQKQAVTYEMATRNMEETTAKEVSTQAEEITEVLLAQDQSINEPVTIDPSYYYQDGSEIMIYNNEALTFFDLPEVSFDEARATLAKNQKISPMYKEYMAFFLDRLEERFPEVDLRVLNDNWKRLEYEEDLPEKGDEGGNFNLEECRIHLKARYIDPKTGKIDEEARLKKVFHELLHTLNYGRITVIDEETLEEKTLVKFFQRTNYGESFSEGITTIMADYLLADNYENYFERETYDFSSYQVTTPYCYQVLKLMSNYNFYDFINKDILYFDGKVKECGIENAVSALDAYFETIDAGEEEKIEIIQKTSIDELIKDIITIRINQEINNQTSNFKILSTLGEIPLDTENKYEIATGLLSGRDDGYVRILSEEEKKQKMIDEKGSGTFQIYGENDTELLNISPRMLVVYKTNDPMKSKYRLAYYSEDQECYDCETKEIIAYNWEEQIDILKILPQVDLIMRTNIVETEDFEQKIDQKLSEQNELYRQMIEEQKKKEEEKNQVRERLSPMIIDAISEGKGDLEICRMIGQSESEVGIAMNIFGEMKEDRLIWYRTELPKRMITVFKGTGEGLSDSLEGTPTHFIYHASEEYGGGYRLGKILEQDGNPIWCDYLEKRPLTEIEKQGDIINLQEIIPEIEKYSLCIKEEFFSSPEFIELLNSRQISGSISENVQSNQK